MRSHQSYPNITTVIHSYEYSPTIDNSTIETSRNRGLVVASLCFASCRLVTTAATTVVVVYVTIQAMFGGGKPTG